MQGYAPRQAGIVPAVWIVIGLTAKQAVRFLKSRFIFSDSIAAAFTKWISIFVTGKL